MKNEKELNKKQRLITGTVTSLGLVAVYTGGVTLARTYPVYHNDIFISTVVISFISPYLLNSSTTYILKKFNKRSKKK